jgi:quercetin dioxygenase-like cupin family protein
MNEQEQIKQLESEGLQNVAVRTFEPNAVLPEHTHEKPTVHIILAGELTAIDQNGSQVLKTGDRVEFPAGTKNRVMVGSEGCSFVMGEK